MANFEPKFVGKLSNGSRLLLVHEVEISQRVPVIPRLYRSEHIVKIEKTPLFHQLHPLVEPQVLHFMQVPLRTSV